MSRFSYLVGRFSGVHVWPVLGVPRGFRETVTICGSFDELLKQIVSMQKGDQPDDLTDLFLDPHDERNLRSGPQSFVERIADRFRRLPLFESYRIAVVVEPVLSRPL